MTYTNSLTIRALDIGHGLIKFTRSHLRIDATLDFGSFPNYAELTCSGINDFSRFTVKTEGTHFCMGPESITFSKGNARQFLEPSFFSSPHCIALALGAVANMKIPGSGFVDILAIGLPMGVMESVSILKNLENSLVGEHVLPNLDSGGDRKFTIRKIKFFAQQEAAASLTHRTAEGVSPKKYSLFIDSGYVNLSWLTKNEKNTISRKSSSIVGGITDLMEPMLASLKPGAFENIHIRQRLDEALLRNLPTIKVNGEEFEVAKYLPILEARIAENVSQILSSVGLIDKIGKVYVTGGGAHLYHRKIVEVFPVQSTFSPHAMSHFDSVRGLQMLAEMQN